MASVNVPAGTSGTLIGNYRYVTLGSPVVLLGNTAYRIGALYNDNANDRYLTYHYNPPAGIDTFDTRSSPDVEARSSQGSVTLNVLPPWR